MVVCPFPRIWADHFPWWRYPDVMCPRLVPVPCQQLIKPSVQPWESLLHAHFINEDAQAEREKEPRQVCAGIVRWDLSSGGPWFWSLLRVTVLDGKDQSHSVPAHVFSVRMCVRLCVCVWCMCTQSYLLTHHNVSLLCQTERWDLDLICVFN